MQRRYDIIIVGGGIAGLTMACCLVHRYQDSNLSIPSIALLDAGSLKTREVQPVTSVKDYDPRVSALTQHSCRLFDRMGVWSKVKELRFADFFAMSVWDGEGTAKIDFSADETGAEKLGAVVENSVICQALLARLEEQGIIDLYGDTKLSQFIAAEDGNSCQLVFENGDSITSPLVVAADGANSMIRQAVGFETRAWDYSHNAIVCTVKTELSHQNTAWQCFTEHGPLAFLPLADSSQMDAGCITSIVWSQQREQAEALMSLSDATFKEALSNAFEHRLGEVEACSERFSFPLAQQHAKDYCQDGVILIGDAAHRIHPLAGQGINLGIKDAECLALALVDDARRGRTPGSKRALGRYSRERKTDNLAMMVVMEGFKQLYSPAPPAVVTLRNRGMEITNNQPWLKQQIVRFAMGVS